MAQKNQNAGGKRQRQEKRDSFALLAVEERCLNTLETTPSLKGAKEETQLGPGG